MHTLFVYPCKVAMVTSSLAKMGIAFVNIIDVTRMMTVQIIAMKKDVVTACLHAYTLCIYVI